MTPLVMRSNGVVLVLAIAVMVIAGAIGWLRQPRQYRADPPVTAALEDYRLMANRISGAPPEVYFALGKSYETTGYDLSQGKRLYTWFECASCHGDGRGAKGPSFIDGWWIYGPSMVSIVSSIHDGRPHGMPAFANKMTADEIWQLAGYIKALGAYKASVLAPARNDAKHTRPAENRAPASVLFHERPTDSNLDRGP